jgi:type III pantothenate kinase
MNLAIDIGNTSIKKATFLDNSMSSIHKVKYSKSKLNEIKFVFSKDLKKFNNISICSVVPEVSLYLKKTFANKKNFYFIQKKPLKSFVHHSVNLQQLGMDRIINVLSVNYLFPKKEDFIVIDLGTATTLDIVKKNKYFGGVILPGLTTSYSNLVNLASGIKKIKLENSNKVFGKNTKDALLCGFNSGYKTMIEGYIKLIKDKFNSNFKVIFTGGYASNVFNNKNQYLYKEDLTLLGISLYHQMFKQ